MAQSTWSADSATWTNTGNVWANTTYADSVALAANVTQTDSGLTNYPSTATLAANTTYTNTGGFSLVGAITLGLNSAVSNTNNAVYVESVTLATTEGLTSAGYKLYVDSITLGTTVNMPLPGTTTWDLETATWTDTTGTWGYTPPIAVPVTATLTQVISSLTGAEDAEKLASILLALSSGVTASGSIIAPVSLTIATEMGDFKTNINFEELATLAAISGISSDNNFLWNDIAEDTGSTWTKVSDPDE